MTHSQSFQLDPLKGNPAWQSPLDRADVALAADVVSQSVLTDRVPGLVDRVIQGGAWVIVGRFGGIVATVLMNVVLAHSLTPEEYGHFILITTVIGLASIAAMFGVNGTIMRLISESIGLQDMRRGRLALSLGVRVAVIAGPCAALVTSLLIAWWHQDIEVAHAAAPITIALLLMAWQQIAAEALRSMQEHRLANLFSGGQGGGVLTISLFISLFLAGGLLGRHSLNLALWLYAAAPLVTLPLALLCVQRVVRVKLPIIPAEFPPETRTICLRQFLDLSSSLLLIQMLAFAATQADVWFAGSVLSAAELARYGATRRLLMVVVIPLQLVNLTVAPSIGELFAAGRRETLQRLLRASSTTAFTITLAACVLLALGGQSLLGLLFGSWYQEGIGVLLALCLGQLVVAWCGSSGHALVMTGRQTTELLITLRAACLLLLLAPLAAAFYGELGIAMAVSISAASKGLCEWWTVRYRLGVDSHPDFTVFASPLARWFRLTPVISEG